MAFINTSTSAINGATIGMSNASTSVYNTASDFIYGIPSHVWCGLSAMDQRYHAEKWHQRERSLGASAAWHTPAPPLVPIKPYEPEYMTNKLLLLEN